MFSPFPIAAGTVSHLFVFVLKELSQITGTENILSEFSPVTITLLSLHLQGGFSGPPGLSAIKIRHRAIHTVSMITRGEMRSRISALVIRHYLVNWSGVVRVRSRSTGPGALNFE